MNGIRYQHSHEHCLCVSDRRFLSLRSDLRLFMS